MVDVTSSNFWKLYPQVKKDIADSSFVALDTEFSGLTASFSTKSSLFDNPEERYNKQSKNTQNFMIYQLGLACFIPSSENEFIAKCYNFFCFPSPINDATYLTQISGIKYLCKQNFDFNKCFYQGIPFLNKVQEQFLRNALQSKDADYYRVFQGMEDFELDDICSQITSWMTSDKFSDKLILKPKVSAKLLVLELSRRFPELQVTPDEESIIVNKLKGKPGLHDIEALKNEILIEVLGLSHVIRALIESKVPIVGHNCYLDFLILHQHFMCPLPEKYADFKTSIVDKFPRIFDTKHIAFKLKNSSGSYAFEETKLQDLFNSCNKNGKSCVLFSPHIRVHEDSKRYELTEPAHEAGYDAYMTGYCFLKLAHFYAHVKMNLKIDRPLRWPELLAAVNDFNHQINLGRAAVPFTFLNGEDPPSQRPSWLCVRKKDWSTINIPEIASLLSKFGSVDVRPGDWNQAIVAVSNKRSSEEIRRVYRTHKTYRVDTYNYYKHTVAFRKMFWLSVGVPSFLVAVLFLRKVQTS